MQCTESEKKCLNMAANAGLEEFLINNSGKIYLETKERGGNV